MPYTYGTPEWDKAYNREWKERLANEPKPFIIFLPEWLKEWEKYMQNDAKYKESGPAQLGENKSIILLPAPQFGLDHDIFVRMDLWHNGGDAAPSVTFPNRKSGKITRFYYPCLRLTAGLPIVEKTTGDVVRE